MKAAMRLIGLDMGDPYPPYAALDKDEVKALETLLGAYADETREALSMILRPGNAGSNTAADHKTVIDLAHNFGRAAVAMGIEKAADALALVSMGCDFGQGFLLGQPMPEERFISLLRQRGANQGKHLAATAR